ncbi:MAG: PHP domain-containing protein [Actinomycetota bacterium]
MSLTNLQIADLLARSAAEAESYRQRAYIKASRGALAWTEEAADVLEAGRSLTELFGVGDKLALRIEGWMTEPPEVGDPPESRSGFSSRSVSTSIVDGHPDWRGAINADLQMHSTYSDGDVSLEGMAAASRDLGYSYIAITDHSQGLKIAGGMSPEELRAQGRAIADLNDEMQDDGFQVLHALEMNISPSGEGDMEPEDLEGLDLVLGSFHSSLRTTDDQTHRYLAALRNPNFHVLGHPRGRMYATRAGLHANWRRVFAEAAKMGKAVEIDCNPNRQDLNAALASLAVEAGCYLSIGTDAHSIRELSFIDMGIATALAAGALRDRILNYMTADELVAWVQDRPRRSG